MKETEYWTMPDWMKQYEHIIGSRTSVEVKVNTFTDWERHHTQALTIIAAHESVRTLRRLHEEGLLKDVEEK